MAKKKSEKKRKSVKYVLSIDGGGIRGILPAKILSKIEFNHGSIPNTFDLIAGTSTGGILALGVGIKVFEKELYKAADIVKMYENEGNRIFKKSLFSKIKNLFSSKYSNDNLRAVLFEYFGEFKLKNAGTKLMCTSYDTSIGYPVFFKSWKDDDVTLVDACLATSAAPTYFIPHEYKNMSLVDGGVVANNPAMCAYIEARKLWPNDEIKVLSISTGGSGPMITYDQAKKMGLAQWAGSAVDIIMDAGLDTVSYQLDKLLGDNFLRIDFPFLPKIMLDDCSQQAIELMKKQADEFDLTDVYQFLND